MSVTKVFGGDILKLIFTATAIANIADNAASSPLANLYLSLHYSNPADTGNQTTGEASYSGYARVAIARSGSGWTVTDNEVVNDGLVAFAQNPSATDTVRYIGIGTASSGTGKLLMFTALDDALVLQPGQTPQFSAGDIVFTCV